MAINKIQKRICDLATKKHALCLAAKRLHDKYLMRLTS
jgi:hypothetical protein